MPDLNGVEAFREIKKLAPDTPVVFMTGGADAPLVAEARREGADQALRYQLLAPIHRRHGVGGVGATSP